MGCGRDRQRAELARPVWFGRFAHGVDRHAPIWRRAHLHVPELPGGADCGCSHGDANSYFDLDADFDANWYGHVDANPNTDPHAHADPDADADGNFNTDVYANLGLRLHT